MSSTVINITTVAVIVFLAVLGMRVPPLDTASKPKPRPRAILSASTKSFSSAISNQESDTTPLLTLVETAPLLHQPSAGQAASHAYLPTGPSAAPSRAQSGRSPPFA